MQIAAVREALSGVGKEILTSEVVACDRDKDRDKLDKLLKKLFKFS
jgi:DNA-binding FrmR family transcriptional regulator